MKLTPGGIYPCPICGKPRGSKQHSGEHDECSRIQQKRTAKTPRVQQAMRALREIRACSQPVAP